MTIDNKIKRFLKLREEILEDSRQAKWTHSDCPLNKISPCEESSESNALRFPHTDLAHILNGVGCWEWYCPFCGERFED